MKLGKLARPFAFAVGLAGGVYVTRLYDDLTAAGPLAVGDRFNAAVTEVYDGDTKTLENGPQSYKARTWGIDAPERSQRCLKGGKVIDCGLKARDAYRELVLDEEVSCEVKSFDDNRDRPVVQCLVDGKDPVRELVREGWAFSDKKYSNDPYATEQAEAQQNKKGLWGMKVMEPSEWRACQAFTRTEAEPPVKCLKPLGPLNPK
jgi:endonuclease YncB( thermonuclease family)